MAPRRSSTVAKIQPAIRCAIYTRKSTDEGLDSDFNSLDAQREIAESYIASQRGEGWLPLRDRYDDGGFSGANTNRPALQRLLADVEDGKVDQVVVYRYDRVSRSLLDFLQLLEFLKKHGVGFVSVSERFDTSTPHGEMALNMVLSVAQCERKVIGQRTSDKISAARRRGKWTGGTPPLGYDVVDDGRDAASRLRRRGQGTRPEQERDPDRPLDLRDVRRDAVADLCLPRAQSPRVAQEVMDHPGRQASRGRPVGPRGSCTDAEGPALHRQAEARRRGLSRRTPGHRPEDAF